MNTSKLDNATRILIAQAIGLKRQMEFYEFWTSRYTVEEGYTVVMYHKKTKGLKPDIIIFKDKLPYMVVEVKNYKTDGYMLSPTLNRAIQRLTQYNCYRLLIISTEDNLRIRKQIPKPNKHYIYINSSHTKKLLKKHNINLMVMGRQDILSNIKVNKIIKRQKNKNKAVIGWIEE